MPSAVGEECGRCLRRQPHFDATHAALRYEFPADRLILSLKYGARLPLASLLANLLARALRREEARQREEHPIGAGTGAGDTDIGIGLVIAMPLHRRRLAVRGFNQSVEIGRRLSRALALPFSADGALRQRDTPPQAGLPLKLRRANVRGAFACSPGLAGQSVAVVDDVMTSGATLDELARELKRAGAVRVENWVVARTWPRD